MGPVLLVEADIGAVRCAAVGRAARQVGDHVQVVRGHQVIVPIACEGKGKAPGQTTAAGAIWFLPSHVMDLCETTAGIIRVSMGRPGLPSWHCYVICGRFNEVQDRIRPTEKKIRGKEFSTNCVEAETRDVVTGTPNYEGGLGLHPGFILCLSGLLVQPRAPSTIQTLRDEQQGSCG